MPRVKIPFTAPLNQNVDAIELEGNSADIIDSYLDEFDYARGRPGLEDFTTDGADVPVDGIFWWDEIDRRIMVKGGIVFSIDSSKNVTAIGSGLNLERRPTFSTTKISGAQRLALANGGSVFTTDGVTLNEITDPDAPTAATHVVFLDKYLLANNLGTGNISFSALNDPTSWSALDVFDTETQPDDVLALWRDGRRIVAFGFRSIEFFYDDGVTPFRRFEGGEINTGLAAAYSVAYGDGFFIFLDENRHFQRLSGTELARISFPFDREIQNIQIVTDALADIVRVDGRNFYVVTFPQANRTFCYDYVLDRWYRWGKWNTASGEYDRFIGNTYTYNIRDNEHLWGHFSNGNTMEMRANLFQDLGDVIRSVVRTGYDDRGTHLRKRCREISLRLKRGIAKNANDEAGVVMLRYRNENESEFSTPEHISTGKGGDSNFIVRRFNKGSYRARQWEIVHTDNTPFIVGDFEEEFEIEVR